MDRLKQFIHQNVRSILPHKTDDEAVEIVELVVNEGVKKEADLRRMTIPILKALCDTVDASDLYDEWQLKYGIKNCQPSTSRSSDTAREPLRTLNVATTSSYSIPVFKSDSPYFPAGVKRAIEKKERPPQKDRVKMVVNIVEHVVDIIPNFQRIDLRKIADQIVELYGDSFKDTILVDPKGSYSLRKQLETKYDNLNRDEETPESQSTAKTPAAYGCLNWNPPLPDGDSEANQIKIKDSLKTMFENTMRHWEWKKVKSEMQATFYLQRKNINGTIPDNPPSRKRRRVQEVESDDEETEAMKVEELKLEWPCLFTPTGMNYHFLSLTGVDFFVSFDKFMEGDGKFLIDYLSSKGEDRARVRTTMTILERRGNRDAILVALVQLLLMHFKENADALITLVEETTELGEVDTAKLPKDKTPHLVVAGPSLFEVANIFVSIDGILVNTSVTFRDAITMLFCSYFVLGIQYPNSLACTLSYVQKAVAKIAPERGTKCQSSAEQTKANRKVTKLSNDFAPFLQSFSKSQDKENRS